MNDNGEIYADLPVVNSKRKRKPEQREKLKSMRKREEASLLPDAEPVIQAVLLLHRDDPEIDPLYRDFRQTVQQAIDEFRQKAIQKRLNPDDEKQARYALITFVDEMVVNSNWESAADWKSNLLEVEDQDFGEALRGEKFFSELKKIPDSNRIVLEIYYLCLALGFEGKYRNGGPEERREWDAIFKNTRRRLGVEEPNWEEELFPEAYEEIRPLEVEKARQGSSWLIAGTAAAALSLVLYLIYRIVLEYTVTDVASGLGG